MNFLPFLWVCLMLVFSDSFSASLFLIKRGGRLYIRGPGWRTLFNYTCCWGLLCQLIGLSLAPVSLSASRQKSSFSSSTISYARVLTKPLSLLCFGFFCFLFFNHTSLHVLFISIKKPHQRSNVSQNTINTFTRRCNLASLQWGKESCCVVQTDLLPSFPFSLSPKPRLLNCIYLDGSFYWTCWVLLLSGVWIFFFFSSGH